MHTVPTMVRILVFSVTVVLYVLGDVAESARILGVFVTPSFSHQIVFRALTMELSKRGHELVVFTSDPLNDPSLNNYKEIDMHYTYDLKMDHAIAMDETSFIQEWYKVSEPITEAVLIHPEMQRIISPNSTERFDLIIAEYLSYDAIYALRIRLDAPIIGVCTTSLPHSLSYQIGNTHALSYSPSLMDDYTDDMNFWLRLINAYRMAKHAILRQYDLLPRQERLLRKYFGPHVPSVEDLSTEMSLVLTSSHPLLEYPRPSLPTIIHIEGCHLKLKLQGLDEDLKEFLDDAKEGFVYFSLGTNVLSDHLAPEKIRTLISVFAAMPYRVVWKWEQDSLDGKPDNVFISKWFSQQDVLAHPNIKLFVYQGGRQSTEEAIHYGVPLVGIPVFGDQKFNVRKLESIRLGKRVNFEPLSGDELRGAIVEVIEDKGYKERMLKFRQLFNDRKEDPMDRAMWWIEYVIRHNGAPHLRPRLRHWPWHQRELLDVLAFVLLVASAALYLSYKFIRLVIRKCAQTLRPKVKTN
ncbi:UDP-glycosyltransferase UGT5-like [Neodiprion virginianus]|uniref:UDP-glycosyltransferase UGT5-like n=1 Tax=Neodiprion virginianus TaxID=2961670 RepID=UPI001EE6E5B6|nr:UDP-glycosyltransferase UGT5-like [Neodiprion virginianus]